MVGLTCKHHRVTGAFVRVCDDCKRVLSDRELDDRDRAARLVGETPWLNDKWSSNADR